MARTIKEIAEKIKKDFISSHTLRTIYNLNDEYESYTGENENFYDKHFSEISIETLLINIVAAVAAVIENMFDWFKKDITELVEQERYGHPGWYEKMACRFQYGDDIDENYYSYETGEPFSESDIYSVISIGKQVVKYAYAEENGSGAGVVIKIAGKNNDTLEPIDEIQEKAFTEYINRIKPAGIPVKVINKIPDSLSIKLSIYYNPLVMDNEGKLLENDDIEPVSDAIKNYLNNLEFNGEFINMRLVDEIQKAEGVEIVDLEEVKAKHAEYEEKIVKVRHTPYAGYMTLNFDSNDDFDITYIPNNNVQI
ncbi:MAG: hypothetical protein LBQ22_01875 [Bacteroidales bacterium]|jgi:hypothetical protein|nr:hypothetical protein [Bacteroidales bacterium]